MVLIYGLVEVVTVEALHLRSENCFQLSLPPLQNHGLNLESLKLLKEPFYANVSTFKMKKTPKFQSITIDLIALNISEH